MPSVMRSPSFLSKAYLAGFPHQQRRIRLGHPSDVIPQQGNALQLAQILPAIHPELPRHLDLLRQHRHQSRVLRGEEARQYRQPTPLQRGGVLRNHAGTAQVRAGAGNQVGQVQKLRTERQVIHVTDERMLGQVRHLADRRVAVQVVLGRIQPQAVIAQLAAHIRPMLRPLQGNDDVRLTLGQADEMRQRQDIHRDRRVGINEVA